eukprot:5268432-Pleurochrysis_carterae.AAC.2
MTNEIKRANASYDPDSEPIALRLGFCVCIFQFGFYVCAVTDGDHRARRCQRASGAAARRKGNSARGLRMRLARAPRQLRFCTYTHWHDRSVRRWLAQPKLTM